MLILYPLLVLVAQLVLPALSRVFETELRFTLFRHNAGWIYIDKMTFDRGRAEFLLETWVDGTPGQPLRPLSVWLVRDDDWPHEQNYECASHVEKTFEHPLHTENQSTTTTY